MTVFRPHRIITLALTCLALAAAALAQEDPCLRRTIPVSVLDEHGQPVAGLTPGDFSAEVRRKAAKILSAQFDNGPRRVVVVLDSSGSMSAFPSEWSLARSLAADALRPSRGKFRAGLVVFNDRVREKIPIQSDSQAAIAALKKFDSTEKNRDLQIRGPTALWDALEEAVGMLHPVEFGDAIYAVTDGEDNASRSSLKDIRKRLLQEDIRLFAALFGSESSGPAIEEFDGIADLAELVRDSGGLSIQIHQARVRGYDLDRKMLNDLAGRLLIVFGALQWTYRLEVALPEVPRKAEPWKLAVTQSGDRKAQRFLVFPKHLAVCTNTTAAEK